MSSNSNIGIILFSIFTFACTPITLDDQAGGGGEGSFTPSGSTLASKVLSDVEHRLTESGSARNLGSARSLSSTVQALVTNISAEIDFRGWKTTDDLTKILPALSHGIAKGLEDAALTGAELEDFSEITAEVITDIALSNFYETNIHYTNKELVELLGGETAKALKHLSAGRQAAAAKAMMRALVAGLDKMGLTEAEVQAFLEDMVVHAITGLVLADFDATTLQTLTTALIDGAAAGLKRLTDSNTTLAAIKNALLEAIISKTGAGVKTLENDGALTNAEALALLDLLDALFVSVGGTLPSNLTESEIDTALRVTGYGAAFVRDDIVVAYPNNEFLVLKFKTMTRLDKEQFWSGSVGGTLVGEIVYTYDATGNIIKKEYYYDGALYNTDEGFMYNGTRLMQDQWGNAYTYDELGRVTKRVYDNGDYEDYSYFADGTVERTYTDIDTGYGRLGSALYKINYDDGKPVLNIPTFWFGNHSVPGLLSWWETDRYDILGAVVSVSQIGKVKSVEHIWTDDPNWKNPPGTYYEYFDLNSLGKVTRFYSLAQPGNIATLTEDRAYDPFQRFRSNKVYEDGELIKTRERFYTLEGDTVLIRTEKVDASTKEEAEFIGRECSILKSTYYEYGVIKNIWTRLNPEENIRPYLERGRTEFFENGNLIRKEENLVWWRTETGEWRPFSLLKYDLVSGDGSQESDWEIKEETLFEYSPDWRYPTKNQWILHFSLGACCA